MCSGIWLENFGTVGKEFYGMRNVDLSKLEAYDLVDVQEIKALDSTGYLLIHKKFNSFFKILSFYFFI